MNGYSEAFGLSRHCNHPFLPPMSCRCGQPGGFLRLSIPFFRREAYSSSSSRFVVRVKVSYFCASACCLAVPPL